MKFSQVTALLLALLLAIVPFDVSATDQDQTSSEAETSETAEDADSPKEDIVKNLPYIQNIRNLLRINL